MDENEIVCWHYDHTKGRNVKGINLLTTFYHTQQTEQEPLRVPIAFDIVTKYEYTDIASKKVKRKSDTTKNEQMRDQI